MIMLNILLVIAFIALIGLIISVINDNRKRTKIYDDTKRD